MPEQYLTQKLAIGLVALLTDNLRDLANPRLAPFYAAKAMPSSDFVSELSLVNEGRSEAGLSPISQRDFSVQTSQSTTFFNEFLSGAGLEATFTADLTSEPAGSVTNIPGAAASFVSKYKDKIFLSSSAASAKINSLDAIQHLADSADVEVADSNSIVRERVRNIQGYLGSYLFT